MPKVEINEGVVVIDTKHLPEAEKTKFPESAYPLTMGEVPELPYHQKGIGAVRSVKNNVYERSGIANEPVLSENAKKAIGNQI